MSHWVRLWDDMPNDPKWRVVAKQSGRPLVEVKCVFLHLLVSAANATERGRTNELSDEDIAAANDMDVESVASIRAAMQGRVLGGDYLTGWEKRQPKREDGSAERSKAWRAERNRTQPNARIDKIRKDIEDSSLRSESISSLRSVSSISEKKLRKRKSTQGQDFEKSYSAYPRHVAPQAAAKAFKAAVERGVAAEKIAAAIERFAEGCRKSGTEKKFIPHMSTWLNAGRYDDEDSTGPPPGRGNGHDETPEESIWNWAVVSGQTDAPRAQAALKVIEERKAKSND